MTFLRPDPSFYPSPRMAMEAPPEKLAYVALLNPTHQGQPDAMGVVDVHPSSRSYGRLINQVEMPNAGNELHHFGWNACSSCLSPYAPHAHMERRYLVVPGLRSSRIHILDTKPNPRKPKFVTDIDLSVDDRFLYVSCWGTGEFIQYDVSDPFNPKKTGSIRLGGIVRRTAHPKKPKQSLNGGPQMVEISRDGRRIYFTNSLYAVVDDQLYPDGIRGWMVKVNAKPEGGMEIDENFLVEIDELRTHQVRLQGGGMTVGFKDLTIWSFLMASAHGAGLMVLPILFGMAAPRSGHGMQTAGHAMHMAQMGGGTTDALAVVVHTAGYLVVTGLIAWLVYEKFGLGLLRKAWVNLDMIWCIALLATGGFVLVI